MNDSIEYGYEHAVSTAEYLRSKGISDPGVGIILGTGLSGLAKEIEVEVTLSYGDIPGFPLSTVESHAGKLIFGKLGGISVIAMQGRFHHYEGYDMKQITFPIRVMKLLGIGFLILSNAAGALNKEYRKGELMLLDDHINLLPVNPLTGVNDDRFGPRFPDMSRPYDPGLNSLIRETAHAEDIRIHEGVYVVVPGPNLETRAEYRFLSRIGADAVGMSTVPEVIVCNHMNLPCAAISVLTDECDPDDLKPVDISEILAVAAEAEKGLTRLMAKVVSKLEI
jgi:purine-nucleoside phosphorylase